MAASLPLTLTLTLTLTSYLRMTSAARILAMISSASPSHHMVIQPILRTIAEAGHDVYVYSMHRIKNPPPTYHEISLYSETNTSLNFNAGALSVLVNGSQWNCLTGLFAFLDLTMARVFTNEKVKELLRSDEQFDLVIIEPFVAQEFSFVFGHIFKAPVIGIQTFVSTCLVNLYLGNVLSLASAPEVCFGYSNQMTFWQRLRNTALVVRTLFIYHFQYLPMVDKKVRVYFPEMPPLQEMMDNLSLMFINEHPTIDYTRPRPWNLVPVGGIHIGEDSPLPQDIKDFMDGAANGVILVSLGSVIPDELRPQGFFESIANTFRKLKQRVIWKTRKENLTGVSDNVKVVKWMSQRDILAHPRCELFITHGGLGSQLEAIHSGVPVVGIPHFGDQLRNVEFYVSKGAGGVRLLPEELTEETLTLAIRTVLGDRRYRDNMRRLTRMFRDTPTTPEQTVVYWVEYVLRHRGARHLKSSMTKLSWYQRYFLDVLTMTIFTLAVAFFIAYVVGKALYVRLQNNIK